MPLSMLALLTVVFIKEVCRLELFAAVQTDKVVKLVVSAAFLAVLVVAVFPVVPVARLKL